MATSCPKHVMLLVGEDTGLHLGCYGNGYATTPNLDRLASGGCRFTQAFTHSPVCAPSRSGLVTGRYPWAIGTHAMRSTLLDPPRLFTHALREAGIHVAWPTKTDFNFEPPAGFADTTDDWLETLAGSPPAGPAFFYRNFAATHESRVWDVNPHGGKTYADTLASLGADELHDPAAAPVPPYLPDTPQTRRDVARYHDNLLMQDREIGRALDALDAAGIADETLVIYLTDHGRGLPREKRWCYDAGIHLPLIVRWPGVIEPETVDDRLVAWVDVAPTILALMGVPVPPGGDGRVFLGEERAEPRAFVFAGRDRMDANFDHVRVARSKRYHYIRNGFPGLPYASHHGYMEHEPTLQRMRDLHAAGELHGDAALFMAVNKRPEELFDARADPDCLRNLADDPEHSAALAEHRRALDGFAASVPDLGLRDEADLIAEGLVADRLTGEYRPRVSTLAPEHRIGPERAPLTRAEAEALARRRGPD
ncbi:sulfatase family protein [Phycisphaera mikurensis]|nr:sulfatase [Phycisphaera mikurensis]MBB6441683.1 putative sulfatase [Phycisphaera mikurensis]